MMNPTRLVTPLGQVADLRDIKHLIRSHLTTHKIALILLEGVGLSYFPDNSFLCSNGPDGFCNEPGDAFYLTLSTGKHQPFAYPTGYRYFGADIGIECLARNLFNQGCMGVVHTTAKYDPSPKTEPFPKKEA